MYKVIQYKMYKVKFSYLVPSETAELWNMWELDPVFGSGISLGSKRESQIVSDRAVSRSSLNSLNSVYLAQAN